ncbi:MAG: glutamate 5-kinase [Nitrospira bacterium HGW-Nitrospira-1]|nr:MAG: glutamate 5-kinase [Nitrospira bacterium HGW-Nitrospira-1]
MRKRFVIKIGSNILSHELMGLDTDIIRSLAKNISKISSMGYEVVIVSSGAVAAGMKKLGLKSKPGDIILKQAAAAIGQSTLMWAYEKAFAEYEHKIAQILLTGEDFSDRKKYINSKNTIITLLSYGIIPVINENDTVTTEEIKFGDNDNLAALVAILIEAERLVILSDVDGLYEENPKVNSKTRLIPYVEEITSDIENIAGGTGSAVGTGGMYSKILAAKKAVSHGIAVSITNGRKPELLISILEGKERGTFFKPCKEKISHRKGWLAYSSRPKGAITIDAGAVKAITGMGKSLLPTGIINIEGNFEVGDSVNCLNADGKRVAKGLINYSSSDMKKIMRKKTSEIEKILGYKYSDEAIHRDNMVIL